MLTIQNLFLAAASGHHAGHGGADHVAHMVVIAGMVLVLAAVVFDGVRRQVARRRPASPHGGDS